MPAARSACDERNRVGVLVLGMHRSGTSALTWLLGRMGAALPRDAIPPSGENSKGYWESASIVKADDALIRAARSSWFDLRAPALHRVPPALLAEREAGLQAAMETAFGGAALFAMKDPRQCRLLPTVKRLLAERGVATRVVLVLRDAAEIAASLRARDWTTAGYAHLLWLAHMLEAERDSRDMPRAVVRFDDLLGDWRAVAARVAPLLGRDGWAPGDEDAREIDAFFEPALRHHAGSAARLEPELGALIDEAQRAFATLADADDEAGRAALDGVAARLAAMPWLEADVAHDELRHRRAPAPDEPAPTAPVRAESVRAEPASPPAAEAPAPDPTGEATLIRGSGLFDADWYRGRYPDAAASGLDPVDHYVRHGAALGYDPNPLFDTGYYARQMARRQGQARR